MFLNQEIIEIDGSEGEGGGQMLRTALTLSMITGQPFRMVNIRARRPKPGLMRQHVVAVQAAARLCGARVWDGIAAQGGRTGQDAQAGSGADTIPVGTTTLAFFPGQIEGGDHTFAIGSAGSCTLVLQTLLPALLFASQPSTVRISGGTHNGMAPPAHFLQRAYARVLAQMGAKVDLQLLRCGFYPAGGGEMLATVEPCARLLPLQLLDKGERILAYAESLVAGVPERVARRELEFVQSAMGWSHSQMQAVVLPDSQGPGNALLLTLEHEQVTEVFCAFGERNVTSENVARKAVQKARDYLVSGAAVGEYLADQIMLLFALAGSGSFTLSRVSQHARTNAEVIARFLQIRVDLDDSATPPRCRIVPR